MSAVTTLPPIRELQWSEKVTGMHVAPFGGWLLVIVETFAGKFRLIVDGSTRGLSDDLESAKAEAHAAAADLAAGLFVAGPSP